MKTNNNTISAGISKLFNNLKSRTTFKKTRVCIGDKCILIVKRSKKVKTATITAIQDELIRSQMILEIMKENQPFWI